jgi:hypothetical protein
MFAIQNIVFDNIRYPINNQKVTSADGSLRQSHIAMKS